MEATIIWRRVDSAWSATAFTMFLSVDGEQRQNPLSPDWSDLGRLPEFGDRAVQRCLELAPGLLRACLQFAERRSGRLPLRSPLLRQPLGFLLSARCPITQIPNQGTELSKLSLDRAVKSPDKSLRGRLGALGLCFRGFQGLAPRLEFGLDLLAELVDVLVIPSPGLGHRPVCLRLQALEFSGQCT